MTRWLDVASQERHALSIPKTPNCVTETMAFRHQDWVAYRPIGTHADALRYAWNWMALLADPRRDLACFRSLGSTFPRDLRPAPA